MISHMAEVKCGVSLHAGYYVFLVTGPSYLI